MGEPPSSTTADVSSSVPRQAATAPLPDGDDDEPPCSPYSQLDNGQIAVEKEPVPPDLPSPDAPKANAPTTSPDAYKPSSPAVAHVSGSVKSFFTRRKTLIRDEEKNDYHPSSMGQSDINATSIVGGPATAHLGMTHNRSRHNRQAMPLTSTKQSRLGMLFHPTRPLGPTPTHMQSFKATLSYNYLNICLLFIPVSWALHFTHQSATMVFVFSCLGIIPLAALLGFGTEQIALRTSDSVGGLLNASLGNVVELIIAGIALGECKLELVQSSLLGGLLSNLLLVLGMAFIVGGYRFHSQEFEPMVAQLNSSLMTVSVMSLIVPAAFHEFIGDRLRPGQEVGVVLQLSRGSAIILMVIYFAYLVFQFYSHNHLFLDAMSSIDTSRTQSPRSSFVRTSTVDTETLPVPVLTPSSTITSSTSSASSSKSDMAYPKLNTPFAIFLLVLITAVTYFTAENLVDSLEGLLKSHPNISQEWLTLIVIPVISNAAEHTTAVVVASKGKFDLAMSVAVGSCIQIALFVIPLLVIVAWGMNKPLTLLFDPLEILVLFFSVLLVKFAVEDGRSHWMSGTVLIAVYVLIALSFWNFPETVRVLQGSPLAC